MGDQYVKDVAGTVKRVADEHDLKVAQQAGLPQVSAQQAQADYNREIAAEQAHRELGTTGEAIIGGLSGLTLGISPAVGAGIADAIDPNAHGREFLSAASDTGAYKAGDFAGMVIPAFFSGGESLAAREALQGAERGVVSRALASTPAGMLGRAGSQAERAITSFLPEASGVMGKAANEAMRYAARGSAEGAIVNLGHTIGDDVIHDKPLSAQSIAASGLEGALFGGLVGGVTGGVGSVMGSGIDAISGKVSGGVGERGLGQMARRFGLSPADIEAAQKSPGGLEQVMKDWHQALESGGANFKSGMPEMGQVASKNISQFEATKGDIVGTLTKEAPAATPSVQRVEGRLQNEVLAQLQGTFGEREANKIAESVMKDLRGMESPSYEVSMPGSEPLKPVRPTKPVWDSQSPYGKTPGPAFYSKYNAEMKAIDEASTKYESELKAYRASDIGAPKALTTEPGSWQKWIESRDMLAAKAGNVGKGLTGELKANIYKGALNIVDDELRNSMEAAAAQIEQPALAKSFAAAEAGIRINKAMAEAVSGKAASRIADSQPHLGPNDGNTMAWGALTGHPIGGVGIVALRGIGRIVRNRLEPHMAEAAYNMSIGAKAAGAVAGVKENISKATTKFFNKASVARAASMAARPDSTPKGFQAAVDSLQELTSAQHQQRMNEYANKLHEIGQEELGQEILATNQRAKEYLLFNMPANPKNQKAGSLRELPTPLSLDSKQFKFMTIHSAITKPVETIVAGLEDGSLNRTQVNAIRYVYPNVIEATTEMVQSKIVETKAEGKFLPADKIATLGILLDAPVDTTLQKSFIDAVQASHDANNAPPPAPQNSGSSSAKTVTAQSEFSTPLQSAIT